MEKYIAVKTVKKWGHALVIVLDKEDRKILNVKKGDQARIVVEEIMHNKE